MDQPHDSVEADNPYRSPSIGEAGASGRPTKRWLRGGNWPLLLASGIVQGVLWNLYLTRPPLPPPQNFICLGLLVGMGLFLAWRIAYRIRWQLRRHSRSPRPPRL